MAKLFAVEVGVEDTLGIEGRFSLKDTTLDHAHEFLGDGVGAFPDLVNVVG
jgi:hypothetical protein